MTRLTLNDWPSAARLPRLRGYPSRAAPTLAPVQTFLPDPDFVSSATLLDDRRLGKQRVETFQILRALTWPTYGWKNHPAVAMWRGFVPALVRYGLDSCDVWLARGRADATRRQLLAWTGGAEPQWDALVDAGQLPPWLGREELHQSHRSALVRKDPGTYRPMFPDVPDDLPYCWPGSVFPGWPLRRGGSQPLDPATALALLGYTQPTPVQEQVLDAVLHGRDVAVPVGTGAGGRTAAVLAYLCTGGITTWCSAGPDPAPRAHVDAPRAAQGMVSASIAREPSPEDTDAMDAEAAAPEVQFVTVERWLGRNPEGVGLVVADGVQLPGRSRTAAAPVLTLVSGPTLAS